MIKRPRIDRRLRRKQVTPNQEARKQEGSDECSVKANKKEANHLTC